MIYNGFEAYNPTTPVVGTSRKQCLQRTAPIIHGDFEAYNPTILGVGTSRKQLCPAYLTADCSIIYDGFEAYDPTTPVAGTSRKQYSGLLHSENINKARYT